MQTYSMLIINDEKPINRKITGLTLDHAFAQARHEFPLASAIMLLTNTNSGDVTLEPEQYKTGHTATYAETHGKNMRALFIDGAKLLVMPEINPLTRKMIKTYVNLYIEEMNRLCSKRCSGINIEANWKHVF